MSAVAPASPTLTSSAPVVSIGTRAAQGAVWTIIFSGLNKVVALASQIALAWFLLPKEMGLFATAMSVASVASIFSGGNLRSVVIQEEQTPLMRRTALAIYFGGGFWDGFWRVISGAAACASYFSAGAGSTLHGLADSLFGIALSRPSLSHHCADSIYRRSYSQWRRGSSGGVRLRRVLAHPAHAWLCDFRLGELPVCGGQIDTDSTEAAHLACAARSSRLANRSLTLRRVANLWRQFRHWPEAKLDRDRFLLLGLLALFPGNVRSRGQPAKHLFSRPLQMEL